MPMPLICPLLSGPSTIIVWTTQQGAFTGGTHRFIQIPPPTRSPLQKTIAPRKRVLRSVHLFKEGIQVPFFRNQEFLHFCNELSVLFR
jgi:hypothetical protein